LTDIRKRKGAKGITYQVRYPSKASKSGYVYAVDCGYAENTGRVASYKKAELVNSLLWYFDTARAAAKPTPAQEKAREWLPDAMRFPAVDPDARAEAEDEAEVAPWADAA
jgi:hypothetical protein